MLSRKYARVAILLSEIVYMVLELCMSYLFSPYFGSSNNVWIGIIGVILLSGSIGNYIGGKLAEKKDKDYVPFLFLLISAFIFAIGISSDVVCFGISNIIKNNTISSLLASFVLLLPVSICLGTLPPQLMAKEVKGSETEKEKRIGTVYMLSTIGGLAGTFVGGYVLIPLMGVNYIVFVCGLTTLLLGIDFKKSRGYINATCVSLILGIYFVVSIFQSKNESFVYEDTLVFDSEYNRIVVSDYIDENGDEMRSMSMSAGFESATYLEEEKRNDLIFDYLKSFNEVVKGNYTNGKDMLMIGGAAYQFPKYALSHYEDASIDVVEIDKKVLEIARKYFFLDDCVNTYDKEGKRHNFVIEDAKVYLINCDKKYDIVFNDAFAGKEPIRTLSTKETAQEVENILNPNGLYVLNVLGTYNESNRKYLYAECNTLSQVFDYVYIRYASNEVKKNENDLVNYVVVASNHPLPMESLDFNYSDAIVLTDNYCPIEILAY